MRIPLFAMILAFLAGEGLAQEAIAPPAVGLSEGKAMIVLARSAMTEYLLHRTPADSQILPMEMQALKDHKYPVAVGLRSKGQLVGRCIRGDSNMPRNVISAALTAMRSPLLPDRITQQVLDGLTIELEVIGKMKPMSQQELADNYVQGWTGLASYSPRLEFALPSEGYEFSLDLSQMQARCGGVVVQASSPADSDNAQGVQAGRPHHKTTTQDAAYQAFAAKHFVGYPGGLVVWLYRGKILQPAESVDEAAIVRAAEVVGSYLRSQQSADGQYAMGGEGGSVADHLHAAYALALLAQRAGQQADITRALAWAGKHMAVGEEARNADARKHPDAMASWAYYVLACRASTCQADATAQACEQSLIERLEQYVQDRLTQPLTGREIALAVAALRAGGKLQPALEKEIAARLSQPNKMDQQAQLWLAWAGLPNRLETAASAPAEETHIAMLDEDGGYPPAEPQTQATALRVMILAARASQAGVQNAAAAQALTQQVQTGKRFCHMMVFKRNEGYFAEGPDALVGAVRDMPSSARTSLRSCAAAIEAFLAK